MSSEAEKGPMKSYELTGLIGKVVRMERPATEEETALGTPGPIGMEAVIAGVIDSLDGDSVTIVGDYGMGFDVKRGDGWRFWIFGGQKDLADYSRWNR